MTTKNILASAISTALLAAVAMPSQAESQTEAATNFAKEGDLIAELRVRNENVQDDNALKDDATAMTARARIGYETAEVEGFKLLAEYDQVVVLQDSYDSGISYPNDMNKSRIADGKNGDFNRVQLSYDSKSLSAVLGRQRIVLDNGRFIGNEGWRQNEQTFDAALVDYKPIKNLNLTYVFIKQQNDTDYNDVQRNDHLFNIGYQTSVGKAVTYAYLLDDLATDETIDTYGIRFSKQSSDSEDTSIIYAFEYANQNSSVSGASNEDADYVLVEAGVNMSGFTVLVGQEKLGGDGTYAFQTPYASAHEFNGWADVASSANGVGLNDTYAKLGAEFYGVNLEAAYHDFKTEKNNTDLGNEWNLLASVDVNENLSAGIKYAQFDANDTSVVDTDKLAIWGEVKF